MDVTCTVCVPLLPSLLVTVNKKLYTELSVRVNAGRDSMLLDATDCVRLDMLQGAGRALREGMEHDHLNPRTDVPMRIKST